MITSRKRALELIECLNFGIHDDAPNMPVPHRLALDAEHAVGGGSVRARYFPPQFSCSALGIILAPSLRSVAPCAARLPDPAVATMHSSRNARVSNPQPQKPPEFCQVSHPPPPPPGMPCIPSWLVACSGPRTFPSFL